MSSNELPVFANKLIENIANDNHFRDYSVKIKSGSEAGDGFTSQISCIEITENDSDKRLDLVCKIAPHNENYRKEFFSDVLFSREALLYDELLPILAKFQEEKNVPKAEQFVSYPKCYATIADSENGHFAIILEDLRPNGYKLWSKSKPSPIENVRITMMELGKLHGLSIAMKDQKPKEFAAFEQVKDIMKVCLKSENTQNMFRGSFDRSISLLKNEDHKNILRHIRDNMMNYLKDCLNDEAAEQFGVLCHGDFWNNNMLFQFNEQGTPGDVKFVDWQIIRYLSPATDIVYNLFTSTDKTLRDKEYENCIKLYYKSLSKMVKLLGSDPDKLFTFENLKDELKRCGNYVLIMAPMLSEVSQADSSKITKLDEACDKVAEGEGKTSIDLITGLSDEGQLEHERRINDVYSDIIRLGYYHKVD